MKVFLNSNIFCAGFFKLSKIEQANLVWEELFVKRSPISEACQGVITTLNELGLGGLVNAKKLEPIREWTRSFSVDEYVEKVGTETFMDIFSCFNTFV